jgi:hypothetical protein
MRPRSPRVVPATRGARREGTVLPRPGVGPDAAIGSGSRDPDRDPARPEGWCLHQGDDCVQTLASAAKRRGRTVRSAGAGRGGIEEQPALLVADEGKPYNLLISDDRIKFMQETNIKRGIQRRELPTEQIVDMSLAREALELAKKVG